MLCEGEAEAVRKGVLVGKAVEVGEGVLGVMMDVVEGVGAVVVRVLGEKVGVIMGVVKEVGKGVAVLLKVERGDEEGVREITGEEVTGLRINACCEEEGVEESRKRPATVAKPENIIVSSLLFTFRSKHSEYLFQVECRCERHLLW
ncbi:MAG: hypothetical protein Q7S32_03575 [bacterium]|nr:hypothetical protein [bacterium]